MLSSFIHEPNVECNELFIKKFDPLIQSLKLINQQLH
jgi:hypothetical protein